MEPTPVNPAPEPPTQPAAPQEPAPHPSVIYPTPSQHQDPTQAASPPPPDVPVKNRRLRRPPLKLALLVIVVLVLLGAGAAAAYLGYYVPNQPQNILAKGVENSLSAHSATTTGTLDFDSGGLSGRIDYTAKIDGDDHAVDLNLKATVSGVQVPLELVSAGGNVYAKVGDLTTLEGLYGQYLALFGVDAKQFNDQVNKQVVNHWIEVDNTLIREAKLGCLSNYPAPLSQSDIQALQNAYRQHSFANITSHASDTVNGSPAYKYQLQIDDNKSAAFNLNSVKYFKDLETCVNSISGGNSADQDITSQLKDNDKTPMTVWVDKKTKHIVKYASQSTAKDKSSDDLKAALSGTIDYAPVKVTAPAGAKPLLNLVNDLGLGGLVSDAIGTYGGVQSQAKDAERKTDIGALQAHVEAYQAENDFYPTLAEMNNASWRTQNLQGLDSEALKDPDGSAATLAAKPAAHVYAYQASPAGCDNRAVKCLSYTLTATLSDGSAYVKKALL